MKVARVGPVLLLSLRVTWLVNVVPLVDDATTKEIEAHANFKDGTPAQYYKNPLYTSLMYAKKMQQAALYTKFFEDFKADPRVQKFTLQRAGTR